MARNRRNAILRADENPSGIDVEVPVVTDDEQGDEEDAVVCEESPYNALPEDVHKGWQMPGTGNGWYKPEEDVKPRVYHKYAKQATLDLLYPKKEEEDEPEEPDQPVEPVNPENPDQPVNPDTPVNPETPVNPDQPVNPENPETPETPTAP